MPWISRHNLIKYIQEKLRSERGHLDLITPWMLEDLIQKYPKRAKNICGCDTETVCDCVIFGMHDDYIPEYEYFVSKS